MLIEGALTEEIINESLPVHYRHASFGLRFLPFTVSGIIFLIAGLNTWDDFSNGRTSRGLAILGIFGLMMFLLGFFMYYKRIRAGEQMVKALGDRANYEIEANDEELITRLSDATYVQKWTVYPKAIIGKNVVLLYQQNNSFAMFHHTFFANDDFSRFKTLVRNHIHEVKED